MMNKSTKPISASDKQILPLQGEISLRDALVKARIFAAQERTILSGNQNKQASQEKK